MKSLYGCSQEYPLKEEGVRLINGKIKLVLVQSHCLVVPPLLIAPTKSPLRLVGMRSINIKKKPMVKLAMCLSHSIMMPRLKMCSRDRPSRARFVYK